MKPETELVYTAFHEGGHAVATVELGGRLVGPVSIMPRRRWLGVAFVDAPKARGEDWERVDVGLPAPLWNARVRRRVEVDVMLSLAGPVGEGLVPFDADGQFTPALADALAEGLAARPLPGDDVAALVRLAPREAKLLRCGDDPARTLRTDAERVEDGCRFLAGENWERLRGWLLAETRTLLARPLVRHQVERVALELLRYGTLPRGRVYELLGVRPRSRSVAAS